MVRDLLDRHEVQALCEALTEPADRAAVEAYWERERPVGIAVKPLGQYAKPLLVPRLTIKQGDRRTLFEPEELDNFAWDMEHCDAGPFGSGIRLGYSCRHGGADRRGGEPRRTRRADRDGDHRRRPLDAVGTDRRGRRLDARSS